MVKKFSILLIFVLISGCARLPNFYKSRVTLYWSHIGDDGIQKNFKTAETLTSDGFSQVLALKKDFDRQRRPAILHTFTFSRGGWQKTFPGPWENKCGATGHDQFLMGNEGLIDRWSLMLVIENQECIARAKAHDPAISTESDYQAWMIDLEADCNIRPLIGIPIKNKFCEELGGVK
jgi:hypothetical protein